MMKAIRSVRKKLDAEFHYSFHITTPGQKVTPIIEWCFEQFGPDLVSQFKERCGQSEDTTFKLYLHQWNFMETDIEAARWEHSDCFFYFKNEHDALLFRLAWPCRVRMLDN